MTTPTTKPSREGLRAAEAILSRVFDSFDCMPSVDIRGFNGTVARIIDEKTNLPALLRIKEAVIKVRDAEKVRLQDFSISRLEDARDELRAALSEVE